MRPEPIPQAQFKLIGVAGLIAASGWAATSFSAETTVSAVTAPDCGLASRLHVEEGVTDTPDLGEAGPSVPPPRPCERDRLELQPLLVPPPLPPLLVAPKNGPPVPGQGF